jgi:hypothetical protein
MIAVDCRLIAIIGWPRHTSRVGGGTVWVSWCRSTAWNMPGSRPAPVDDATSRLMQLRFVASESAFDYFRATCAYLETHGKPVALYSDKHSIFRVNRPGG